MTTHLPFPPPLRPWQTKKIIYRRPTIWSSEPPANEVDHFPLSLAWIGGMGFIRLSGRRRTRCWWAGASGWTRSEAHPPPPPSPRPCTVASSRPRPRPRQPAKKIQIQMGFLSIFIFSFVGIWKCEIQLSEFEPTCSPSFFSQRCLNL